MINTTLNNCLDIHERLHHIHSNCNISWGQQNEPTKNLKAALAAREAGGHRVKQGEGLAAVLQLNTAMRLVPVAECEEVGWIAATRSAATFLLGLSDDSYQDCSLALECLPHSLTLQRFKLWDRAAVCSKKMGRRKEASDAVERATEELKQSSIAEHIREKLLKTMKDNLEKSKNENENDKTKDSPTLIHPGSNRYVSKKVCVVHNEVIGRHVKAVEDIAVGEVIVQEDPISSVLHLSKLETNCSNCMRPAIAGVSCDSCTRVIFCSTKCKKTAEMTFHKVECGNLLLFPPLGPLCPALRLITSRSLEYFLENKNMFDDHNPCAGWDEEIATDEESHLMRSAFNMQVCDKDPDYVVNMTAYAYLALVCLNRMNFFGKKESLLELHENELYIGKLLYHFLRGVEENSHEIVQFEEPGVEYSGTLDSLYDGDEPVLSVIGAALNSITSLFNNSCDVNTIKYHQGNTTIMMAKRNIKAGEEVCDFYGQHFFQSSKQARHQMLGFQCQCNPCKENWPLINNLPKFTNAQLSQKSRRQWQVVRDKLDMEVNNMRVMEAVQVCKQLAGVVGVSPPHQALVMPEMYLHYSLVFLYGNKSLSFKLFSDKVMEHEEAIYNKQALKVKKNRSNQKC